MNTIQRLRKAESRIVEGNYTLGELNRARHASIVSDALRGGGILNHQAGHLRFEKGQGVKQRQKADCLLCEVDGLNDGEWHDPKTLTMLA